MFTVDLDSTRPNRAEADADEMQLVLKRRYYKPDCNDALVLNGVSDHVSRMHGALKHRAGLAEGLGPRTKTCTFGGDLIDVETPEFPDAERDDDFARLPRAVSTYAAVLPPARSTCGGAGGTPGVRGSHSTGGATRKKGTSCRRSADGDFEFSAGATADAVASPTGHTDRDGPWWWLGGEYQSGTAPARCVAFKAPEEAPMAPPAAVLSTPENGEQPILSNSLGKSGFQLRGEGAMSFWSGPT